MLLLVLRAVVRRTGVTVCVKVKPGHCSVSRSAAARFFSSPAFAGEHRRRDDRAARSASARSFPAIIWVVRLAPPAVRSPASIGRGDFAEDVRPRRRAAARSFMSTIAPSQPRRCAEPGDGGRRARDDPGGSSMAHGLRFDGPGLFDEVGGRGRIALLRGLGGLLGESAAFGHWPASRPACCASRWRLSASSRASSVGLLELPLACRVAPGRRLAAGLAPLHDAPFQRIDAIEIQPRLPDRRFEQLIQQLLAFLGDEALLAERRRAASACRSARAPSRSAKALAVASYGAIAASSIVRYASTSGVISSSRMAGVSASPAAPRRDRRRRRRRRLVGQLEHRAAQRRPERVGLVGQVEHRRARQRVVVRQFRGHLGRTVRVSHRHLASTSRIGAVEHLAETSRASVASSRKACTT